MSILEELTLDAGDYETIIRDASSKAGTSPDPDPSFDLCITGIGADMLALQIPSLDLIWHTKVDIAACFGIYHIPEYQCHISHGELEIARISYNGDIVWSSGSKDIFTTFRKPPPMGVVTINRFDQ